MLPFARIRLTGKQWTVVVVPHGADRSRTFEIEVPAEFPVEGLPGQKIQYEVTVKQIKEKVLPPLDDAFASNIAAGKTLADLRGLAREEISEQLSYVRSWGGRLVFPIPALEVV